MRITAKIGGAVVLTLAASACAAAMRAPLTDVPPGGYVLVEPESDVYNAVTINERAFSARIGDEIHTGQHWVDSEGRLRMADDAGPCAGQESIWTYAYSNNRVTLNLVEDLCAVRSVPFPDRMVYQRR
jgi:hypothetical protein